MTDHCLAKGLDIESKSLFLGADLAPKPAKVSDDDQDALSQLSLPAHPQRLTLDFIVRLCTCMLASCPLASLSTALESSSLACHC